LWARPTLDINGMWSGFTGDGAKTVIPAKAHAKISMRLVPDQTPKEIGRKVERYLKSIAPKAVKVKISHLHGGSAWLADTHHPALQAAGNAMKRAFGKKSVFVREGGSIPIVATLDETLHAPCILMGLGLNDDNLHAPNEKMELDNFFRGNEAAAYLQEELGAMTFPSKPRTGGKTVKRSRR
jgi:acetylornithine deacetylase/succinyl-diaminopimelate desuccinylase-like protein